METMKSNDWNSTTSGAASRERLDKSTSNFIVIEPSHDTVTGSMKEHLSGWKKLASERWMAMSRSMMEQKPVLMNRVRTLRSNVETGATSLRGTTMARWSEMTQRGRTRMSDLNRRAAARVSDWKQRSLTQVEQMRATASSEMNRMVMTAKGSLTALETEVRSHPMKWAGISTGAGLGIGLASRWMYSRSHRRHVEPSIVYYDVDAC